MRKRLTKDQVKDDLHRGRKKKKGGEKEKHNLKRQSDGNYSNETRR